MDDLIQQGVNAFKSGDKENARKLLSAAIKQNPDSERAWGWMYNVTNNDKERIACLQQMVRINPKNEKARQILSELTGSDFPLERPSPQTTTAERKPPSALVAQAEKSGITRRQSNLIVISIISIVCIISLLIAYGPQLFNDLNCQSGGGLVYFCSAKGILVTDSEKLESAMREFCEGKKENGFCEISVWPDKKYVPMRYPLTDSQVLTKLAQYNQNESTGYDCFRVFQNGEIITQSSGCSK